MTNILWAELFFISFSACTMWTPRRIPHRSMKKLHSSQRPALQSEPQPSSVVSSSLGRDRKQNMNSLNERRTAIYFARVEVMYTSPKYWREMKKKKEVIVKKQKVQWLWANGTTSATTRLAIYHHLKFWSKVVKFYSHPKSSETTTALNH